MIVWRSIIPYILTLLMMLAMVSAFLVPKLRHSAYKSERAERHCYCNMMLTMLFCSIGVIISCCFTDYFGRQGDFINLIVLIDGIAMGILSAGGIVYTLCKASLAKQMLTSKS